MKNVLQIELNKAIKTRYFAISIIIGTMIGIVGLVYNVNLVYNSQIYDGINPCYEGFTLFNHWIGGEGFSLGSSLYFFVFPLLIALPYGWSFCGEKNSGYMRQMLVRAGEKKLSDSQISGNIYCRWSCNGSAANHQFYADCAVYSGNNTCSYIRHYVWCFWQFSMFKPVLYAAICLCSGIYAG